MAKKASNNWKGIPANERKAVATIRNFSVKATKDSPQQIWREIRAHRAAQQQNLADEAKANAERAVQEEVLKRQCAKNQVDDAMGRMADVRDMLGVVAETSSPLGMDTERFAFFMRAGMIDAMRNMEDALVDLNIIDWDAEFFVERPLRTKAEQAA